MPGAERLARAVFEIDVDGAGLQRGLDETERKFQQLGRRISSVGRAVMPLSLAVGGVGIAAVKMATDLNASMANVATLIPGNTTRINELKSSVQELAIDTGKSTQDLSEGLYNVVSAFGDSAETAQILEQNARAAAAGLATTAEAIDLTSAVTKGYGDASAKAVETVSDLALTAVKLGQTTFPELAASIGRVTPLAAELGLSQQELFGVMATATGVTGGAAEVSTQLRGILQSLMAPTADMRDLFEDLGVSSGEALIGRDGLQGAVTAIVDAVEASGQPLQKFVSSIEGQTLALSLSGAQADVFSEKLAAMSEAAGATDEAFKAQTEGVNSLGFMWNQLKQKVVVAGQQLGEAILPVLLDVAQALQPAVDWATRAVRWFGELPQPFKTAAVVAGGLVVALGPVAMAIGSIITTIGPLIPAIVSVGGTLAALATGPVAIVVGALVGLAAAWYAWGDDVMAAVSSTIGAVVDWLGPKLAVVWEPIQGLLQSIGALFSAFRDLVGAVFGRIIQIHVEAITAVISWLVDKLQPVFGPLGAAIQVIQAVFEGVWRGSVAAAQALYEGVKTWLVDRFTGIIDRVKGAVDSVTGVFESMYQAVVGGSFVPDMVNGIEAQFSRLGDVMVNPAGAATSAVKGLFNDLTSAVTGQIDGMMSGLTSKLQGFLGQGGIGGLLGGLAGSILPGVGGMLGSLAVKGIGKLGGAIAGLFKGNETKKDREQFASMLGFGNVDQLFGELNSLGAGNLVHEALNVIGKKDKAANQQWMLDVQEVLDTAKQAAGETAEAFTQVPKQAAESAVESARVIHDSVGATADVTANAMRDVEHALAAATANVPKALDGMAVESDAAVKRIADSLNARLGDLRFDIPVGIDVEGPGGGLGLTAADTEPIPRFDNRPLERVTRAGLAFLDPGDVVGVPTESGAGRGIHMTFNISSPDAEGVYRLVRTKVKHELIELLRDDPDARREFNGALGVRAG